MTTPTYPLVRYPDYITPHGEYHIFKGRIPEIVLTSFDGTMEFYLMGGRSITDHLKPEAVRIKNMRGLVAPWQMIDQKGATQDGVTFVTSLYDPMEIELNVEARGRDPQHCRQVVSDFYASLDNIKQSTLSFYTHGQGRWWAKVRWAEPSQEEIEKIQVPRQNMAIKLRVDEGFWQTYDDADQFRFAYETMSDSFTTDYSGSSNLGPNWPLFYSGAGAGYLSTTPASVTRMQARWYESGSTTRTVVAGPYKNFNTSTDTQEITIQLGTRPEDIFGFPIYPPGAYNDIWGRMNRDGSGNWAGNGIRARVGRNGFHGWVRLSRFNGFSETLLREHSLFIPPQSNEKFTLVCGYDDDPRQFRILRNGLPILIHKEVGTSSSLGASYRGIGFGMTVGTGSGEQNSPAWVRKISAGDNATATQSGFLQRVNIGDQKMFDDYTLFGPGTFRIYNGPGSSEFVEFGPMLPNQVILLRSHPGKRSVHDLTNIPPTPQESNVFQGLLDSFLSFAFANNVPPLLQAIQSFFGVTPPQGNAYTLLKGRFSDDCAIPPRSPGGPLQAYYVKVEIVNGNADSKIIASGTPLRKYPM